MEQFYLILIGILAAGALLLLAWLKPDLAKKYWGYILAAAGAIGGVVFLIAQRKRPAPEPDPEIAAKEVQLREDLTKVHAEAEATIAVARTEEHAVQQEVEEIKAIPEEAERLRRLSELFNRTRRR